MNLKPNLWTVLFLLTAGWLFYTTMSSEGPATVKPLPPPSDSIPAEQAIEMIAAYDAKVAAFLNDTAHQVNGKPLLEAMDVVAAPIYFKLEANELQEIIAHWGGQNVYALLALKPSTNANARDTIDLIFSDVEPGEGRIFLEGTFYDFSTPCPPLCNQ